MEVKTFRLDHVGRFKNLVIDFAPTEKHHSNVTVIVGNNGAGKTTLLESLAISLSWLASRIRTENGSGRPLPDRLIPTGSAFALSEITVEVGDTSPLQYQWLQNKTRKGRKSLLPSNFSGASRLADRYRTALTNDDNASLPLVAYYPVERSVLDIPLKIRTKHSFGQLDGYANALEQGVDFRRFFEWFREREDSENESGIPDITFNEIEEKLGQHSELWKILSRIKASSRDRQLTAVRSAISNFMSGFSNLRVRRKPFLRMTIDKDGTTLNVDQLSQGEKSLMALVGDIARRLAMMNPSLDNPLHGDGIVLIDEVDLHLHPGWQHSLIQKLTNTFPKCQFVLTSHSPLLISDARDVLCYVMNNGELEEMEGLYGLDANQVLLKVMDTDFRNSDIQQQLDLLLDHVLKNRLDEAKTLFTHLKDELPPGHIELAKAELLIRKQELRHAKD